ncbi:MAG: J domain-containing protein [Sulfobacillus sp.]|nr:J domain-containing protein [Sulfobacillus sp.]
MAGVSDPWQVLGIGPTRDVEAIRQAYLNQVRQNHPDRFRSDPVRYRQQEERMKHINLAYQEALASAQAPPAPPPSTGPAPHAEAPVLCSVHRYPAGRRCKRCQAPICLACAGYQDMLCSTHWAQSVRSRRRNRVLREWLPVIAIIGVGRIVDVPRLMIGLALLIYIAYRGFTYLTAKRWWGCLALLLLPYSLILGGLWSLWESVRQWNEGQEKHP